MKKKCSSGSSTTWHEDHRRCPITQAGVAEDPSDALARTCVHRKLQRAPGLQRCLQFLGTEPSTPRGREGRAGAALCRAPTSLLQVQGPQPRTEAPQATAAGEHARPCRHQPVPQGHGTCAGKQLLFPRRGAVSSAAAGASRATDVLTSPGSDGQRVLLRAGTAGRTSTRSQRTCPPRWDSRPARAPGTQADSTQTALSRPDPSCKEELA